MSNMKVVSLIDHEIRRARETAISDLEQVQQSILVMTTELAEALARLTERVEQLEQRGRVS